MSLFKKKAERLARQTQNISRARRKEETLANLREIKQKQTEGLAKAKGRGAKAKGGKVGTGVGKFIGFMQSEKVQSFGSNLGGSSGQSGGFNFNVGQPSSKKKKKTGPFGF